MKKSILLTGGAGYIGSILTNYLLENGYVVRIIDNFIYEQNTLASYMYNKNLEVIKGDIRDKSLIKDLMKKSDIIIPLAGYVGAPLCNLKKHEVEEVNFKSNTFLFSLKSKDQIILMPTTNSAYGSGDEGEIFDETSELKPISSYATEKVKLEKELLTKENVISFRLATVFGASPRMRLDLLVNDFVYRAFKDGFLVLFEPNFKRNYIHIRDVCEVFTYSLNNFSKMKNQIYNVGLSDANLSKKELCEIISEYLPLVYYENNFKEDPDKRNYIVSNSKLENTGFNAKFSIRDGIKELIKLYTGINLSSFRNI